MSNPLCDADTADCIGWPQSLGVGCPTSLVRCVDGELGVQSVKVAQPLYESIGDAINDPMVVGTLYGTLVEHNGTNPWCDDALVWVNHEFGAAIKVGWTDNWGWSGDISCSGSGVEFIDGITVGSYALGGNDGSSQTANNLLQTVTLHQSFSNIYKVPAGGAFTIRQQVRFVVGAVGAGRTVNYFVSTMRGMVILEQP